MGRSKRNWDYLVDYGGNYQAVLGTGSKGSVGVGAKGDKGAPGLGIKGSKGPVGQKGSTGSVGAKGDVATGAFIYRGAVANAAALPTTGNALGDSYTVSDTNTLSAWDGTQWVGQGGVNVITVKGQKGEVAQKGQKGDGQKGQKGAGGVNGTKGNTGAKGIKGDLPLISALPTLP